MNLDELANLITKGKELLQDNFLDASSGKVAFFRASGKELLKDHPDLVKGFEKATIINQISVLFESNDRKQAAGHECVANAIQEGITFLERIRDDQSLKY